MAVMDRRLNGAGDRSARSNSGQVVDCELDMDRPRVTTRVFASRLERIVAWMIPSARIGGAPMRSVAREIEELLPSREH
jgi:hypothetical protein